MKWRMNKQIHKKSVVMMILIMLYQVDMRVSFMLDTGINTDQKIDPNTRKTLKPYKRTSKNP